MHLIFILEEMMQDSRLCSFLRHNKKCISMYNESKGLVFGCKLNNVSITLLGIEATVDWFQYTLNISASIFLINFPVSVHGYVTKVMHFNIQLYDESWLRYKRLSHVQKNVSWIPMDRNEYCNLNIHVPANKIQCVTVFACRMSFVV